MRRLPAVVVKHVTGKIRYIYRKNVTDKLCELKSDLKVKKKNTSVELINPVNVKLLQFPYALT